MSARKATKIGQFSEGMATSAPFTSERRPYKAVFRAPTPDELERTDHTFEHLARRLSLPSVRSSTAQGADLTPSAPGELGAAFSRSARLGTSVDRQVHQRAETPKVGLCRLCGMIHELPGACP